MRKKYFYLLIFFLIFSYNPSIIYSQGADEVLMSKAGARFDEGQQLEENKLNKSAIVKYNESIDLYLKLIREYPKSSLLPKAYYKIGVIYSDYIKNYRYAVKYCLELFEKFPETKEGKYGLFLTAFHYDNSLKNKDTAILYYRLFLKMYPEDKDSIEHLSESARILLDASENSLSIEEIIKNKKKVEKNNYDSLSAEDTAGVYAQVYVVIADTGKNYFELRKKMFDLRKTSGMKIDTLYRGYIKKKNLIAFPENYENDPDYAGLYFPRREESEFLSLEYVNYYMGKNFSFENAGNTMTIAIVSGVFFDKSDAEENLKIIKAAEKKAFILKGKVYLGCMH